MPMGVQISVLIFLSLALPFQAGKAAKVDRIGPFNESTGSDSVRKALEPQGYRIVADNGKIICDIWLRNGIPTGKKTEAEDLLYRDIAVSTLVGVISFPQGGSDYRGQHLSPGAYTLRYALLPNDGNHMGVATYRDFLLLAPIAADKDVNAMYDLRGLVDLSRKATGTHHPAPFNLVYPGDDASLPAVVEDDEGHLVFSAHLKIQSGGERTLSLVVRGQAEQ